MVGAPASGKTYLLSCMSWELRKHLPNYFQFHFSDADAETNRWINAQEETLFMGKNPEHPVFLKKTELQGELYNQVVIQGMAVQLPSPSIFVLKPQEAHARYGSSSKLLTRNLILYDNAGEHFQPGMDTPGNPGTQHLMRSQAILFVFDPTSDPRIADRCRRISPHSQAALARPQRQEVLLTEMVNRMSRYRGLSEGAKIDIPLLVVVTKYDVWKDLLSWQPEQEPIRPSKHVNTAALDMDLVASASLAVRELLRQSCPEIVNIAESFSRYVFYIPVSALGHPPQLDSSSGAYVIRPADIRPWWVTAPFLVIMAELGFIPVLRSHSTRDGAPKAAARTTGDQLHVEVPGSRVKYQLPLSFAGRSVRCPQSSARFTIPDLKELAGL
jgi:hypothetical protein